MPIEICQMIGHTGKVRRKYYEDKTCYRCYKCQEGKRHVYDVEMFDEDRKEDEKGRCPYCKEKMPYQRNWTKYINCTVCKKEIWL